MYKSKNQKDQLTLDFKDFFLPFGGKLNANNRWVKLSRLISWDKFEEEYSKNFSDSSGAPALSFRVALGALIIKERLHLTDRETVEQITENPYLQYFLGFAEFRNEAPFDHTMLVHFRKRMSHDVLSRINEMLVQQVVAKKNTETSVSSSGSDNDEPPNSGKLIIDATCTPADIRHPTDISILNEAREKSERIIDVLWEERSTSCPFRKKPRTYRKRARKDFLAIIKKRKDKNRSSRKSVRKQLNYLKRNLAIIEQLKKHSSLSVLSRFLYRCLLVIHEVYRQQQEMYTLKIHRTADRIVSITQPHVRPIVRGKAGKKVEFGAKISASSCDGFSLVDRICWDAYNESSDLVVQAENYKRRFGHYPSSIHADTIYRNRNNRRWCKERNIRLSGLALGRPQKITDENKIELKQKKKLAYQDEIDRIDIEGRFGCAKRRYGLDRIMAKLAITSESVISMIALGMNLEKILRDIFSHFFYGLVLKIIKVKRLIADFIRCIIMEVTLTRKRTISITYT